MIRSRIARLAHSASILLCAGPCLCSALAQGGLKVIDNPGGGQVMYGPVANQTTQQGTMLSVLRYIHGHFGNRPQVGNIFEGRDSQTFGSFFLVTAKSGNQAGRPLAGLVLISLPRGAQPAAAILYDDSSRFAKTEPVLLRKLAEAWKRTPLRPSPAPATQPPPATFRHSRPPAFPTAVARLICPPAGASPLPRMALPKSTAHGVRPFFSATPRVPSTIPEVLMSNRVCATPIPTTT